jgi:hypothetical protein
MFLHASAEDYALSQTIVALGGLQEPLKLWRRLVRLFGAVRCHMAVYELAIEGEVDLLEVVARNSVGRIVGVFQCEVAGWYHADVRAL